MRFFPNCEIFELLQNANPQMKLAAHITEHYENMKWEQLRNSSIERLCVKLSGRVALVELKPRDAKWKYNRGSRLVTSDAKKDSAKEDEGNKKWNIFHH